MKYLKTFEGNLLADSPEYITTKNFEEKKETMIEQIDSLQKDFGEFTKYVSPGNWRTCGHFYAELTKIKEGIKEFKKLINKDLESEHVKKGLED